MVSVMGCVMGTEEEMCACECVCMSVCMCAEKVQPRTVVPSIGIQQLREVRRHFSVCFRHMHILSPYTNTKRWSERLQPASHRFPHEFKCQAWQTTCKPRRGRPHMRAQIVCFHKSRAQFPFIQFACRAQPDYSRTDDDGDGDDVSNGACGGNYISPPPHDCSLHTALFSSRVSNARIVFTLK